MCVLKAEVATTGAAGYLDSLLEIDIDKVFLCLWLVLRDGF